MDTPRFESIIRGLQEIITNPITIKFINSFSVDESARQRIRQIDYTNYASFIHIKENWYTLRPAEELSKLIPRTDDITTKWFLFLYSIASVNDIYMNYIYKYADERIKKYWRHPNRIYAPRLDRGAELDHILDGLINLDAFKEKLGFHDDYMWPECRQGIILFCLSAGYHWNNARDYVTREICDRGVGMPISLSLAYYVSVLTGKDFYDSLHDLMKSNGTKAALDDIITMAKAEKLRQQLIAEKKSLLEQLSKKEEAIRQQDTALDIVCKNFGSGTSEEELNERISNCNKNSSREVLYKAESIVNRTLSFTDEFKSSEEKKLLISNLSSHYDIILSSREVESICYIEDLVNAINDHRYFIELFKSSLFYDHPIEVTSGNVLYDLNAKVEEIRHIYGENIDFSNVRCIDDIRRSVINAHPEFADLAGIIIEKLGIDPSELQDSASFQNDLGADSLDIVEIIMDIEKKFDIEISDEEAGDKISTVGDARLFIYEKLREKAESINH